MIKFLFCIAVLAGIAWLAVAAWDVHPLLGVGVALWATGNIS
jgi:hypothetical protein